MRTAMSIEELASKMMAKDKALSDGDVIRAMEAAAETETDPRIKALFLVLANILSRPRF